MNDNSLIENIDRIHTTVSGAERIKTNLKLGVEDPVEFCKTLILKQETKFMRIGKNWYAISADCKITVNAHSYTIITAHKIKS